MSTIAVIETWSTARLLLEGKSEPELFHAVQQLVDGITLEKALHALYPDVTIVGHQRFEALLHLRQASLI